MALRKCVNKASVSLAIYSNRRLSDFIRHAPWAQRCGARQRDIHSNIACSRSSGFIVCKRRPCLHSKEAKSWEAKQRGQECLAVNVTLEDKGSWSWACLHPSKQHLFCQRVWPFITWHLPGWLGPVQPAEEMDLMSTHFEWGFIVEMGCGISGGKQLMSPASTGSLTNESSW